jgi:hypothetical protein
LAPRAPSAGGDPALTEAGDASGIQACARKPSKPKKYSAGPGSEWDMRFGSRATISTAPAAHVDGDPFWGLVRSRRRGPLPSAQSSRPLVSTVSSGSSLMSQYARFGRARAARAWCLAEEESRRRPPSTRASRAARD